MLKLPIPAYSTQLLGKEFVGEEGRGANLIDIGGGAVQARPRPLACQHALRKRRSCCLQRMHPPGGPPRTGLHACLEMDSQERIGAPD